MPPTGRSRLAQGRRCRLFGIPLGHLLFLLPYFRSLRAVAVAHLFADLLFLARFRSSARPPSLAKAYPTKAHVLAEPHVGEWVFGATPNSLANPRLRDSPACSQLTRIDEFVFRSIRITRMCSHCLLPAHSAAPSISCCSPPSNRYKRRKLRRYAHLFDFPLT